MSYSSTVLADSPRWYLRLGEASGTTAADASGNSLPGAYTTGGGTFTYSRPGLITDPDTAIKFNGSTPYVHVPDTQAYTSATLEAWVAPADTTDRSILIQSNGAPGSSYSLLLRTVGGKFQAHVFDGAARTALASTAFTVGVTYHVAATCTNSGSLLLYIDGVLETTTTGIGTMWTGNNDWFIGYTWNSDVDEVAVYTSVLSAARIAAHYTAGTVSSGDQTISPTGIASASAVGSPTLTPGSVTVSPTGIASVSAVGSPTVGEPPQIISPVGIASAAAVGTPTLTGGAGPVRGSTNIGKGDEIPVLVDWSSEEKAVGGWMGMTARTSQAALEANPEMMQEGSTWTVFARETGDVVFHGRVKAPANNRGYVDISADGPGVTLLAETEPLFYAAFGTDDWVSADGSPHNYHDSKKYDLKTDSGVIRYKPNKDEVFHGGETAGPVFMQYGQKLSSIHFLIDPSEVSADWELVLRGGNVERNGFGSGLNVLQTWPIGSGDARAIEYTIPGGHDIIRLVMRRRYDATGDTGPGSVDIASIQEGSAGVDEVQSVTVTAATGGTFTLDFDGDQTDPIAYNATAGDVEAALRALSTIGLNKNATAEDVSTSGGPLLSSPVVVHFIGSGNVPRLTATTSKRLGNADSLPVVKLRHVKVFGIATDDDYSVSDVVRDLCARMNVDDSQVRECGVPVLPANFTSQYGDIVNLMAMMAGWHAFIYRVGGNTFLDFGPYHQTRWYCSDPEVVRDLTSQPLFNHVIVEHRWEGSDVTGTVEAHADPDPLDRTITAPVIRLGRKTGRRAAQIIANRLANDLCKPRWMGSILTDRLQNTMGQSVPANSARAGDQIYLPDHGWLDVDGATRTDTPLVTFSFAETSQLFDRYEALRTRTLT